MNKNILFKFLAIAAMLSHTAFAEAQISERAVKDNRKPGPIELKLVPTEPKVAGKMSKILKTDRKNAAADTDAFYGRTIYGALINSTEWANTSITDVPYGLYSFEMNESPQTTGYITNFGYNFLTGAYSHNRFVGITAMSIMGMLNGARYITIDTENWTEMKNIAYGTDKKSYGLLSSAMAYNPMDNRIYSFQYKDDLSGLDWCVYNPDYDEMDKIASFRGRYNVVTLAAVPSGEMYFINGYGDLYKIDRKTARPSLVGYTGITPILYVQNMMYDGRTGMFLWAAQTSDGSSLYSVDPATAETKKVLDFKNNEQFVALWSLDNEAPDGAPAQANDLKMTYDKDGGLEGTISFEVPTTTFDGKQLGNAVLYVWLDGEIIKTEEAQAGSRVSIPVSLTEGNHYVAVNLSNDEGFSPLAYVDQYAGYDIPKTVGNLTFTYDKAEGKNTISWTAPEGGLNGGYVDYDNLTYTIVRMPDSVTVADNYKETSFTEDEPQDMRNYSYRVYAVNNGKSGNYSESNKIICGNAFAAPYSQSFADASVFTEFFTVIDANEDGNTWRSGYSGDVRIDLISETSKGDDWLITPAIKLDGGTRYSFTMNMKTFTKGYPEDFELYVGTDPEDISTFKLFKKEEGLELYETYSDYKAEFNIEADGDYYVGIRYLSDKQNNGSLMLIKSVSVTKIGATKAPAPVSELKITPDADDAMAATISFVTPDKNLNDEPLSAISKVNVYRNGSTSPVHVFDSPAVNTALSWTDATVSKVGVNTYSVVAENEYGEGGVVSDSAFVGIYTAPYLESFDTRAASELYKSTLDGIDLEANPYYGWTYDENNKKMTFYAYLMDDETKLDAWLYTPMFKLDANAVYELGYNSNIMPMQGGDITYKVFMGTEQEQEAQSEYIGDMPLSEGYMPINESHNVITTEGGKFCFGFNIQASGMYAYPNAEIDNVSLTYLKSASSPFEFTDFKSEAYANGDLMADISFKAPAVDYHGNKLTENLKVEIYRGQNPTPVFSKEGVVPGSEIKWTDTQALHGQNTYMLVASNSYGRSEVLYDTLFVGRDVPMVVSDYRVKGSADNMNAIISWNTPETGANGGVIVADEISFNVYKYNPTDKVLTLIEKGVKDNSYVVENEPSDKQKTAYYAVSAVNTEGEGQALVGEVVLGKLYEMPFKESFANKELSTEPWMVVNGLDTYITWGVTNPDGESYNGATPQDNDGGVAYMYNGNQYETFTGAGFVSPKIALGDWNSTLKFWVYNIATAYPNNKPIVMVYVRADDGDIEFAGEYVVGSDTEEGWKQYEVKLDKFAGASHISFVFYGFTGGYQDVIYLDNIEMERGTASGISDIGADGKAVKDIKYYDVSGRETNGMVKGINIRVVTYTDGSTSTQKVMVK